MKKFTPYILIYHLELKDKNTDTSQSLYFLTKRSVKRFLKNHKKEIEEQNLTWSYGGERLWIW